MLEEPDRFDLLPLDDPVASTGVLPLGRSMAGARSRVLAAGPHPYAAAHEFQADGETVLATGDQQGARGGERATTP